MPSGERHTVGHRLDRDRVYFKTSKILARAITAVDGMLPSELSGFKQRGFSALGLGEAGIGMSYSRFINI